MQHTSTAQLPSASFSGVEWSQEWVLTLMSEAPPHHACIWMQSDCAWLRCGQGEGKDSGALKDGADPT